jgi:hypothetical protein
MKKLIAAAAGLLIAGTMVSSAVADVTISGDARVRAIYLDNYDLNSEDDSDWNSRVRLTFKGSMESGVTAVVRMKADVSTWDEAAPGDNVEFDRAYFTVPLGNNVTVIAGMQPITITSMVLDDIDYDALAFAWAEDNHQLVGFFSRVEDDGYDNNINLYAVRYQGTYDQFGIVAAAMYVDNDMTDEASGFGATVRLTMDLGMFAVSADYAFIEAEANMSVLDVYGGISYSDDEDAHMGYVTAAFAMDEQFSFTGVAGFTERAVMDNSVGFIMIGGDTMISAVGNVGAFDGDVMDTTFVGVIGDMTVNEKTSLRGVLAYADLQDDSGSSAVDGDVFEISGQLAYAVNADTTFTVQAGWANIEVAEADIDEDVLGIAAELAIKF